MKDCKKEEINMGRGTVSTRDSKVRHLREKKCKEFIKYPKLNLKTATGKYSVWKCKRDMWYNGGKNFRGQEK
jgi:hypothetical protein